MAQLGEAAPDDLLPWHWDALLPSATLENA
jgi:hypothetical protein